MLALVVAAAMPACVDFPGYEDEPSQTPSPLDGCFGMHLYQPNEKHKKELIAGRQKVCDALSNEKLDQVFAKAFDGTLAARTTCTGALEMVEGPRILEALRTQLTTWTVHVFVVPRAHELASTNYGMRAISLTPRRLEGVKIIDTMAHELTHLVEAPVPIGTDSQWLKDGGHRSSPVPTNQYASYFVGHAVACLTQSPNATVEQLVECAETKSF